MLLPTHAEALRFSSDEEWRPVPGFESLYDVSDHGHVRRSSDHRPMRAYTDPGGYQRLVLTRHAQRFPFAVHTLVLLAFVGPGFPGAICRHLNGTPDDNRPGNLMWGTSAENAADRDAHGTTRRGERVLWHKLTEADVVEARRLYRQGASFTGLARRYRVTVRAMKKAIIGLSWSHIAGAVSARSAS